MTKRKLKRNFLNILSWIGFNSWVLYLISSMHNLFYFRDINFQLHHRCLPYTLNFSCRYFIAKFMNKFAKLLFDIGCETFSAKVSSGKISIYFSSTSNSHSSIINNSIRSITSTTSLHAIDISHHWCVVHVYELCFNYAILLRNFSFFSFHASLMSHPLYQII